MRKYTASSRGPRVYRIVVQGQLDKRRAAWFDGMTLSATGENATAICGPLLDQAALFGLLSRVRDLGLVLVSVSVLESGSCDE